MEFYSVIKKEWNNAIFSGMDAKRDYHTKRSQRERQMCNITYMRNLKYGTNEPVYKTDSQTGRTDVWLPRGRGGWGRMDWEFQVSKCKLLHIKWINNKVLIYSTWNYIQYLGINHNGKNTKNNIYIYN